MSRALDPDGLRYLEYWEPVLALPAMRALDRLGSDPRDLLDLGAGTGSLTMAALRRWPQTRVTALDAARAMLAVARSRVPEAEAGRVSWLAADAAELPLDDESMDAVASSFMLQIVADRPTVLAEVRRVLQPGGVLSFVTWLAEDLVLPADAVYHELLGDIDDAEDDETFRSPRSGDYTALEEARDELAAAGFESIEVTRDELRHAWTAESYLAFKTRYDDRERIDTLDEAQRAQLLLTLADRLSSLPPEAFEVRGPLVAAVARTPAA